MSFIWYSKDPPIYIFEGDIWINEKTKDIYFMSPSKHSFIPENKELEKIPFTKKTRILSLK